MATDTTIAPGVTYEVAVCVTKQTDPTVARVADAGRTDVEVVLSLSDGGPAIQGLPASFHATDANATMTDPFDPTVTGQKYLATILGSATLAPLTPLLGNTAYRYATVAGEPMGKTVKLAVVPTGS